MLKNIDKQKLEQYIDKIINEIEIDANKNIKSGMSNKQLINKLINDTVNKFTPQSKVILSSTYNMLMERTLSSVQYSDTEKKSAFYEMDILKELNGKFNFKISKKIDYEDSTQKITEWLTSWIPVGITTVMVGIKELVLKNQPKSDSKGIEQIIKEYLTKVKQSMLLWINSIEKYYDDRVAQLEREMIN